MLEKIDHPYCELSFAGFLNHIPNRILQNPKIIAKLCELYTDKCWIFSKHWDNFSQIFVNNRELVLQIVKFNPNALRYASHELQNNFEIVMAAVKENGYALIYASELLKGNREIVLQAVMSDGFSLISASGELMRDAELQKVAIRRNPNMFPSLVKKLSISAIDIEVIELALHLHGKSLAFIPSSMNNYRNLVITAVKNDGKALSFAPSDLKADREVVWEAVSQNGYALFYASTELKQDRELIFKALESSCECYLSLPSNLQDDLEIILQTLKYFPLSLQFVRSKDVDIQIIYSIVEKYPSLIKYAPSQLRGDKNLVLKSVEVDGNNLVYASSELKADPEIILKSAKNNFSSIRHVQNIGRELAVALSEIEGFSLMEVWNKIGDLKTDEEFIKSCIKRNGKNLFGIMDESIRNNRELIEIALETDTSALPYAEKKFRDDVELIKKALLKNPKFDLPEINIQDREIVELMLRLNGSRLSLFPNTIKNDIELVMTAVRENGCAFLNANENLIRDSDMQSQVVKESGFCLKPTEEYYQSRMEFCYFGAFQPEHVPFHHFNDYPIEFNNGTKVHFPNYLDILHTLQ